MNQSTSKYYSYQYIGFAVITFLVLLVYYPSLLHSPRADHVMYLAEVAQKYSWSDLAIHTFDLNRHRHFSPGDQLLFRPVMYFILGSERFFFQYHFILWQAMGIILHLTVVWFLLRFLLTISLALSSVIAAGVFALMYINMEMVIWQHINGYMVFMILLLIALRRWWLMYLRQGDDRRHVWMITLCILFGCFTYEVMNVFAVLFFLFTWFYRQDLRRYAGVILIPVGVYIIASTADAILYKTIAWEAKLIVEQGTNWIQSIGKICWTLWFWFFTSMFAVQLPIKFAARNIIESQAHTTLFNLNISNLGTLTALVLSVFGFVYLFRSSKKHWLKALPLCWLLCAMMLSYAAVIVFGRANSRGIWDILRVDLYYNYLFCLLAVIFITIAIDWKGIKNIFIQRIGVCVLCLFVVTQAMTLHQANNEQARLNEPILVLINSLNELIKQKKHESDFSFFVADQYPGNYIYKEIVNIHDISHRYSLIEALYPQYYRRAGAKYSFLTK